MSFLLVLSSLFIGLAVGSFLNVVIRRGVKGESFGGRSHCESCGATLSAKELIPVVSFLIQRGRCIHCDASLSWQYPIVEITTALFFALAAWMSARQSGIDLRSLILLGIWFIGIAAFIVVVVTDIRSTIIPNGAVFLLFLLGMGMAVFRAWGGASGGEFWGTLSADGGGAFGASFFLASLWFVSQGKWMGFGDVKLVFTTSLLLGYPSSLVGIIFSFWAGGIIGIALMLFGKKTLQSLIPFGPFIIVGTVIAYFFADQFLHATGLYEFL